MFGMWDAGDDQERRNRRIRERAESKHGGTTTSFKARNDVKVIAQKYGIADCVKLEDNRSKGFKIVLDNSKVHSRLSVGDKYGEFMQELVDAINDCGYDMAVGDDFFDIFPVR